MNHDLRLEMFLKLGACLKFQQKEDINWGTPSAIFGTPQNAILGNLGGTSLGGGCMVWLQHLVLRYWNSDLEFQTREFKIVPGTTN